jgi:hypothetical protein
MLPLVVKNRGFAEDVTRPEPESVRDLGGRGAFDTYPWCWPLLVGHIKS